MSVLVYTENWEGKFKKLSCELVSYASRIAEMTGGQVTAVSIGDVAPGELEKLGNYGAQKILNVRSGKLAGLDNQLYTDILVQAAEKAAPKTIILSNNNTGRALAPRVAVRLKAGLAGGTTALPVSTDPFIIPKKVFSGKATAHIRVDTPIRVVTLYQNSFEIIENNVEPAIEEFSPALNDARFNTHIEQVDKVSGKVILTDADIVVSGGRGMKGPENWGPLEELADLLDGATACSRPVSDEGWRPHEEHTGQTGKIIAPNLYFAFGISGAIQHLAGVSGSKYIVAVNTDKDAPIFEAADYGIVGDALKVLPDLIEAVKRAKSQ